MKRLLLRENASRIAQAANPGWTLRQWGVGTAWFFIVLSALHLIGATVAKLSDPSLTFKMFRTEVDGTAYNGVLLTYVGILGLALVLIQLMAVTGAVAGTVLSNVKWRRIGHVVLMSWAGLWLLNFLYFLAVDHSFITLLQAAVVATLFVATCYRAAYGWTPPTPRSGDISVSESANVKQDDAAGLIDDPVDDVDAVLSGSVDSMHMEECMVPSDWKQQSLRAWRRSVKLTKDGSRSAYQRASELVRSAWPRVRDGFRRTTTASRTSQA